MIKHKIGRWEALCGATHPFLTEADQALPAQTTISGAGQPQVDVWLSQPLPGFSTPLWGFDGVSIYLRQPEGIWKFEAPNLAGAETLMICQNGKPGALGGLGLDVKWLAVPSGWRDGEDGPLAARALDEARRPPAGCPCVATEAWPLTRILDHSAQRTLIDAGEAFGQPPSRVWAQDGWLLAADVGGRVVAFDLSAHRHARAALEAEKLWLRFHGPWLGAFEVRASR